jgi:hypothetical protein
MERMEKIVQKYNLQTGEWVNCDYLFEFKKGGYLPRF